MFKRKTIIFLFLLIVLIKIVITFMQIYSGDNNILLVTVRETLGTLSMLVLFVLVISRK